MATRRHVAARRGIAPEYTQGRSHWQHPHRPRETTTGLARSSRGWDRPASATTSCWRWCSGTARPGPEALALANAVLARAGGPRGLLRLTDGELRQVPGIGPARAAQVLAALELGRRTVIPDASARQQFTRRAISRCGSSPQFGAHPVEQFGVVLLDTKFHWLATRIVSVGALDRSPAAPRDVFREAVAVRAAFAVVFHNHPSGDRHAEPGRHRADAAPDGCGGSAGHRAAGSPDPDGHRVLQLQGAVRRRPSRPCCAWRASTAAQRRPRR